MAYREFHNCSDEEFECRKIIDTDGAPLNETELGSLLHKIITRNDTTLLKHYITAWNLPRHGNSNVQSYDPFYTAAAHGSLDVLRVLLDVHGRDPDSMSIEEEYGFSLLHVACEYAQMEIVKFLLDCNPPLATVHDGDAGGWTPILAAAYSTAPGEALMSMLLDRGASACDSVLSTSTDIDTKSDAQLVVTQQAEFTVLSQAITGSSYGMIKRLVEHGADAQECLQCYSDGPGFWDKGVDVRDVTPLHIGSRTWNVDGIRALLGHCHGDDLILSRYRPFPKDTLVQWITDTLELLVPKNDQAATATLINSRDRQGATPLHYAVRAHASCRSKGSNHAYHKIQWLCSHGADAGIVDHRTQTALHLLAYASLDGEPIDLGLVNLLLAHGCPLDTSDEDGETPLHNLARHLRQGHAAKMLLECGARVDLVKRKGNLPLHVATRVAMRPKVSWELADLQALLDAHGMCSVLHQPNNEGKTPRQLREETRRKWKEIKTRSQGK
ncbi:ankyrin repeat-containing domain protein [Aspergillus pseudoustus]|uniref:Ankyrin repeat-containing domain protein n=1 Tax=Aspergillus pseudoustus TaxID=1810923 RepID=A0ABR4K539_9EURO